MILKQFISACALILLVLAGCDSGNVNVRALPAPSPEQPPANLPVELHQRNWTGSLGQGSCVHASLVNHLRWLNKIELGNAGDLPTPMASGTRDCEIDSMQLELITATRSKLIHDFLTGPVRHAEERSFGGSQPTVARSLAGSNARVSNTLQSSTTTIQGDSN